MRVLVVDVGGTNVKILATGQKAPLKFPSGPSLTLRKMVAGGICARTLEESNRSAADDALDLVRMDDDGGWQMARPPA